MRRWPDRRWQTLDFANISCTVHLSWISAHLLRQIKEWNEPPLFANISDGPPLVPSKIHSSRIMSTTMQNHYIARHRPRPQSLDHALKVNRESPRAEVWIRSAPDGRVDQRPYLVVVDPRRIRNPDGMRPARFRQK